MKKLFLMMWNLKPTISSKKINKKWTNTQAATEVVNPRHQTPQGQSVAKPGAPWQNILLEKLNIT